jgi:hypothetical protein
MTSTNTYTHPNHYLTLVCNIALKNKYTRWYFNIISRTLERPRNRADEFKTKNRAGVLKSNNYRIQTGAHNFLSKNRTDEHEITRKQNHLAVCAKPIRIECGDWFCMEYSSISAARKSGFPVGLLEALIKNNGVYTVQRNRKHRSGKSTGTAFMKGHVLKLIYVTIA